MRKHKILLTILTLLTITYADIANAQVCSAVDKSNLKTCVDNSLETCRAGFTACNDYEPVLSIKDVSNIAINNCCDINRRPGRITCLNREKMKYSAKLNSGPQRSFSRAARQAINNIARNVCRASPYSLPASSALF